MDRKIKFDLVLETLAMLNLNPKRKKKLKQRSKIEYQNRRETKDQDPVMTKSQRYAMRKKY